MLTPLMTVEEIRIQLVEALKRSVVSWRLFFVAALAMARSQAQTRSFQYAFAAAS